MKFIADLHVHSKFSRATARNLDLENIYISAQLKGITVVATGDFTHPGWFCEIKEKLVPAEAGLFRLKDEIAGICDKQVPLSCRRQIRFMLVSEISNIYKKNGKTRKNHSLVFSPDFAAAAKLIAKLDKIGNIKSDGRPILGLDVRDLLEIVLETSPQAFLIPAHIWTPWFSVFGSKSGFDSLEECFEDLSSHIFAAETGLSSDPAMNWRVSGLDHITLISNSDAHSPANLGREANLFDTDLSYGAIKAAMETGDPKRFLGTFEFYPEEGKYHLDGHRKCNVCFSPSESIRQNGICPVCGKNLTLGVLYRISELADRTEGKKPVNGHPFYHIIPLVEILSELSRVGPKSKKVQQKYRAVLEALGSEFAILHTLTTDAIDQGGVPLLAEAILRMRRGRVNISSGYDGEYGSIKVFKPEEMEALLGQKSLFILPGFDPCSKKPDEKIDGAKDHQRKDLREIPKEEKLTKADNQIKVNGDLRGDLNHEQTEAVRNPGGPLMIIAGPGTGKTRILTHRIAYLLKEKGVLADNILAVTFTNKAAKEMSDRLDILLEGSRPFPLVATFHSLSLRILKEAKEEKYDDIIDDYDRKSLVSDAIKYLELSGAKVTLKPSFLLDRIISAKQQIIGPWDNLENVVDEPEIELFSELYRAYNHLLIIQHLYDYEDLIFEVVKLLETKEEICRKYRDKFKYILVDEYQDLNQGQYRIIRALAPPDKDLCVIGDPDQSIYGFRGSDVEYFNRFQSDYPKAKVINLTRNYRSTQTILKASSQVITNIGSNFGKSRIYSEIEGTKILSVIELDSEKSEAVAIGKTIEQMVGGTGFHFFDFDKADPSMVANERGFSDFAVLSRTGAQSNLIADVFERAGIPCQVVSRENLLCRKGVLEIISWFRIVEGFGSYADLLRVVDLIKSEVSKIELTRFKTWCYHKGFAPNEALKNVGDYLEQVMSNTGRLPFEDFSESILKAKKETAGMTVEKKLIYLTKRTKTRPTGTDNPKVEEALNSLIISSQQFGNNSSDFFTTVSLKRDPDTYDAKTEKVSLMTMHAAKGLEFPVVFIAGCERGLIPYQGSVSGYSDQNEERRLFYVALTRAKEQLYLTWTKNRRIYGKPVKRELSPFVEDIEKKLRRHEKPTAKKMKGKTCDQLKLF